MTKRRAGSVRIHPASCAVDETSLIAVCAAGEGCWGPENPDFGLIGACAVVESEFRERQFDALELFLAHVAGSPPHDHLIPPADPRARLRLAEALVTLGWNRPGAKREPTP
jgi:hypothetical protein